MLKNVDIVVKKLEKAIGFTYSLQGFSFVIPQPAKEFLSNSSEEILILSFT